jgi:hypothetical protein
MLSACEGARTGAHDIFSSTAATLLRRGIPAVVAMQYEITDEAAIEFARAFYEALADAVPVDAAVGEARKTISRIVSSSLEWGTPVLYMHAPTACCLMFINHRLNRLAARYPLLPLRTVRACLPRAVLGLSCAALREFWLLRFQCSQS